MIPAPLAFEEVGKEDLFANALHLGHAQLGIAPEAFNAIDVVLSPGELVVVMMDAVVLVALSDETVVGLPAVGVDGGLLQHLALDDGQQLLAATGLHGLHEDFSVPLEQADDWDLARGAPSSLTPHSARAEVALVDLDLSSEGSVFLQVQTDDPPSKEAVEAMGGVLVDGTQSGGFERWNIGSVTFQDERKFALGKARFVAKPVLHWLSSSLGLFSPLN